MQVKAKGTKAHNKRVQSDKLLRYASQFAADAGLHGLPLLSSEAGCDNWYKTATLHSVYLWAFVARTRMSIRWKLPHSLDDLFDPSHQQAMVSSV